MQIAIQQAMELMAIPGPTANEGAIAACIRELLMEMGVPAAAFSYDDAHKRSSYGGEIGNMIVTLNGHGRGMRRMLSAHIDTVVGAVGSKPRLDGNRVVNDAGNGSLGADDRSGVAALLAAARALIALKGNHPPCVLLFLVQEEVGLVGSKLLDITRLGDPLPAIGFNFDGEAADEIDNEIVGTERLHIDLKGIGVHTARPEQGISCVDIFTDAFAELSRHGWHGVVERDGGWATANLGTLNGGTNSNVTMPSLHALAECRSFDINFRTKVLNTWKAAFEQAVADANHKALGRNVNGVASVKFTAGPEYPPCVLHKDSLTVRVACEAIRKLGRTPKLQRDAGGQDTCNLVAHGIPTVGVGAGMRNAHARQEFLDIPEFMDACRLAIEIATMDITP